MNFVAVITIATSLLVIFGWLLTKESLLSIVPNGATMKFNTAALFFLSGIGLFLHTIQLRYKKFISVPLATVVIAISSITIFEYLFAFESIIDSLVIKDIYSEKYPGRMSAATASSFICIGISIIGVESKWQRFKQLSQHLLTLVLALSLLSSITYLLQIPLNHRVTFIDTMAIHTSILFGLLSISLSLKNHDLGFTGLILGRLAGSSAIRSLLPLIVILPVALSYLVLVLNNIGYLSIDFGIALYTVLLIFIAIISVSIYSTNLNSSDLARNKLEVSIRKLNKELMDYKLSLDRTSLVAVTNSNGIIQHVNDLLCQKTGYERNELLGQHFSIFKLEHHSNYFFKKLWQTIKQGEVWVGEVKNNSKQGEYFWLRTSIVPFKNETGHIYQYLLIGQDISERKKTELVTKDYVKKLKQKNKEIEEFAYITSHDLQEPLRTVANYASLFINKHGEVLGEQGRISINFITDAILRMQELIKGILDYSQLGRDSEKESIDCQELLKTVLKDMSATIDQHKAKIVLHKLPHIIGGQRELRLLFQNLISNAIKFRKENTNPVITISAERKNNFWQFSINDNGIGISTEHGHKIFRIFQRLHKRTEYNGLGIGLAHCKKIVELHNGEIWFDSKYGQGTTFYFTLKSQPHEKET